MMNFSSMLWNKDITTAPTDSVVNSKISLSNKNPGDFSWFICILVDINAAFRPSKVGHLMILLWQWNSGDWTVPFSVICDFKQCHTCPTVLHYHCIKLMSVVIDSCNVIFDKTKVFSLFSHDLHKFLYYFKRKQKRKKKNLSTALVGT